MSCISGAQTQFTLEQYRHYLELALECGYLFVGFEAFEIPSRAHRPEILLRHDIDYAPRYMSALATLEADAGIRATYCVQLDSRWYRLESEENQRAVTQVLDAGHALGLHF